MTGIFKERLTLFVVLGILAIGSAAGTGWWFLTKTPSSPPEIGLDTSDQTAPIIPETEKESSSSKTSDPPAPEPSVTETEKSSPEPEEENIPRMSNAEIIQQVCEDLNKENPRIKEGDVLQVEGISRGVYVWGDWGRADLEIGPIVWVYYDSTYERIRLMCRFEAPFLNETELKSLQDLEEIIVQGAYDGYRYHSKKGYAARLKDCVIIYRGEVLRELPEAFRIHIQK